MEPVLSIIVVTWRVPDLLRDCLNSVLEAGGLASDELDIIVVDNASDDNTVAMLRAEFPWVTTIASTENLGFGRANTLALPRARAPFVLLLNPDTLVRDGGLAAMLTHIRARPQVAALGCRLVNADGSLQRWTGGRFPTLWNTACHYLLLNEALGVLGFDASVYLTRDRQTDCEVDWVSGACMLLRREWVPEPLFDPSYFMYGEDMDLCWRMRQAGGRILYSPVATVVHFQGASMRQQSGAILLTSLKGIRSFYARRAGPLRTWVFDLLTLCGFALRWGLFSLGARLRRADLLAEKARSSRGYARMAWAIMRTGRS